MATADHQSVLFQPASSDAPMVIESVVASHDEVIWGRSGSSDSGSSAFGNGISMVFFAYNLAPGFCGV